MRLMITIVALLGATPALAQDDAVPEGPGAVRLPGAVALPMNVDLVKPTIPIEINGRGPYRFLLDTGASPALVLNTDLVRELGLTTRPGPRVGDPADPEAIQTDRVDVERVSLGDAVFERVPAIAWDRSDLYSGDDAPRGIVGFALFRDILLTVDYPGRRVVVAPGALRRDDPGVQPYRDVWGTVTCALEIAGRTYDAHLDTGSMGEIMLPLSAANDLPLKSEPVVMGRGRTVNTTFEISAAPLDGTVVWGPLTFRDPEISFTSVDLRHVNIGSGLLDRVRLTFDQANRLLRIEEPADAPVATPRRRYGLGLNPAARPVEILRIEPGSLAEESGLRVGDVIVAINGTAVADLTRPDFGTAFRAPSITLRVDRDGAERDVTMRLETAPGPRNPAQPAPPSIEAEITALLRTLETRFADGDLAGIAAVYADDAVLIGPTGVVARGRRAIDDYWRGIESPVSWTLDADAPVGSGRLAVQRGRSTLTWRDAGAVRTSTVNFELIWVRDEAGDMRIVVDAYWTD